MRSTRLDCGDLSKGSDSGWVHEWLTLAIRCEPAFEQMLDEADFFEKLQVISGW